MTILARVTRSRLLGEVPPLLEKYVWMARGFWLRFGVVLDGSVEGEGGREGRRESVNEKEIDRL